jgi:23S rRNA-intervening sequence protein
VRIALGSLAEVDTQLELARRLGLLLPQDLVGIDEQLARSGRLLHGLARGLKRKQVKNAAIGSAGLALALCLLLV